MLNLHIVLMVSERSDNTSSWEYMERKFRSQGLLLILDRGVNS